MKKLFIALIMMFLLGPVATTTQTSKPPEDIQYRVPETQYLVADDCDVTMVYAKMQFSAVVNYAGTRLPGRPEGDQTRVRASMLMVIDLRSRLSACVAARRAAKPAGDSLWLANDDAWVMYRLTGAMYVGYMHNYAHMDHDTEIATENAVAHLKWISRYTTNPSFKKGCDDMADTLIEMSAQDSEHIK